MGKTRNVLFTGLKPKRIKEHLHIAKEKGLHELLQHKRYVDVPEVMWDTFVVHLLRRVMSWSEHSVNGIDWTGKHGLLLSAWTILEDVLCDPHLLYPLDPEQTEERKEKLEEILSSLTHIMKRLFVYPTPHCLHHYNWEIPIVPAVMTRAYAFAHMCCQWLSLRICPEGSPLPYKAERNVIVYSAADIMAHLRVQRGLESTGEHLPDLLTVEYAWHLRSFVELYTALSVTGAAGVVSFRTHELDAAWGISDDAKIDFDEGGFLVDNYALQLTGTSVGFTDDKLKATDLFPRSFTLAENSESALGLLPPYVRADLGVQEAEFLPAGTLLVKDPGSNEGHYLPFFQFCGVSEDRLQMAIDGVYWTPEVIVHLPTLDFSSLCVTRDEDTAPLLKGASA